MEKRIEKQKFYVSEFREEAAWLSFMHRQGWKFLSTTGWKYEFEPCTAENYCYELDFKENDVEDEDYIQLFADYGWEYVFRYRNWFYFRKPVIEGTEEDYSIFSDNESKIAMCKRVIRGQALKSVPICLGVLLYDFLYYFNSTYLYRLEGIFKAIPTIIAVSSIAVIIMALSFIFGQYSRLRKMIKSLESSV